MSRTRGNLGSRLRGARLKAGLSLRQLAAMVGVCASTQFRREEGAMFPFADVAKYARRLGVTVEWLVRDDEL